MLFNRNSHPKDLFKPVMSMELKVRPLLLRLTSLKVGAMRLLTLLTPDSHITLP